MNDKTLSLDDFQKLALSFRDYNDRFKVDFPLHGLAEEVGEVSGKYKKALRDDILVLDANGAVVLSEDRVNQMKIELGDVLWYVAMLAYDLGATLQEIATINYKKLTDRQQRGVIHGEGDSR